MKKSHHKTPMLLIAWALFASTLNAQESWPPDVSSPSDSVSYWAAYKKPSAAELRQQFALEELRQRRMLMQYNEWRGYSPLRPVSSALPMMRSNYVVPYVRPYFTPYVIPVATPVIRANGLVR